MYLSLLGKQDVRMRKKKKVGTGKGRAFSVPPSPRWSRIGPQEPFLHASCTQNVWLGCFSLLCLERKEERKRKLPMNISCSSSADFLVP